MQSLSSQEDTVVEFVETSLSPRLQCEAISAKRRLHCNDPTGVIFFILLVFPLSALSACI